MHTASSLLALASLASATKMGFNYGSTFTSGAAKAQSDFEDEFTTAQNLKGTSGWTSARLYTMVQGGTTNDPISAIPAAISTKTSLLLGLWASGGDAGFDNELAALKTAIGKYDLSGMVDGISVGSEDLYRNSPQGIEAGSDVGTNPDVIVGYINQVKNLIKGTALADVPIGHVDTWTAWDNSSNQAVVDACDWVGMDAYPYFQSTMANGIDLGKSLFDSALSTTQSMSSGKPVWVTETGYPVSGDKSGDAVASIANAEYYWKHVGCPMFGEMNVWWYTLQDAQPDTPSPSFGLVGSTLSTTPLYDLSCDNTTSTASTSASASGTKTATTLSASGTGKVSSSGTGSANGTSSTGSSGSGSGSGSSSSSSSGSSSGSSAGSGSGAGSSSGSTTSGVGSNSTYTTSTPSSTGTTTAVEGVAPAVVSGGMGAAFVAIMAAIFAL
ncbi:glycoside hydrolase [Xylariaceae sp. FL0804]|nr:glycoside hydrolase [Xylariaceae sp. FL0804]